MVSISEEYNRKNFLFFLKEFLPEDFIEKNEEYKLEKNNSYFKNAFLIGSVDSLKELAIFEIQRINPEKSRIKITKELFKFLELHGLSQALIITYSDKETHFRFSYVKSNLNWINKTSFN